LTEETGNYNPITKTRSSGRQLTDAGMAKFKEAASDGMITPKEYEQLGNGDVYVAERVGSKIESQGRLDQGIPARPLWRYTAEEFFKRFPEYIKEILPRNE